LPTQKEGFTASLKENNLKDDEVARVGGAAEETNIVLIYDALKKRINNFKRTPTGSFILSFHGSRPPQVFSDAVPAVKQQESQSFYDKQKASLLLTTHSLR
ncbi:unnamed protein product, partial [Rotaria magnacalcarata]